MAKKNKEDLVENPEVSKNNLSRLRSILKTKKYDNDILVGGSSLIDDPPELISISPRIDLLLNGGITSSSWINILGAAKLGKSSISLRMAAQAQKKGYFVLYVNAEHRLKKMNLEGTHGLIYDDPEKFMILQSSRDKVLTGQDFLIIIEDILKNFDKVICIIDSISSLSHPKQVEEGTGTYTRGGMGVLVSQFINNCAPLVCQRKHIMIVIQQMYNNTGGYGKTKLASGGTKVTYQGDCILEAKSKTELKSGEKIIGHSIELCCECSSNGTIPFTKTDAYMRYGYGIDPELELVEMGKEFGVIEGSGWLNYKDTKIQGLANFAAELRKNKELYESIQSDVNKAIESLRDET